LLVTHDLKTAGHADRMLRMRDGQIAEAVDRRQVL